MHNWQVSAHEIMQACFLEVSLTIKKVIIKDRFSLNELVKMITRLRCDIVVFLSINTS